MALPLVIKVLIKFSMLSNHPHW